MGLDGENGLKFHLAGSLAGSDNSGAVAVLSTGKAHPDYWHHVVFIWDRSNVKCYLNGISSTETFSYTMLGEFWSQDKEITIGCFDEGEGVFNRYFPGKVDFLSLYDNALSDYEVRKLYDEQKPTPPNPPTLVSVDQLENRNIKLKWQENSTGFPPYGFYLYCNEERIGKTIYKREGIVDYDYEYINFLQAGDYTFTVKGFNRHGNSIPSNPITITVEPADIESPLIYWAILGEYEANIVELFFLRSNNGSIRKYRLYWRYEDIYDDANTFVAQFRGNGYIDIDLDNLPLNKFIIDKNFIWETTPPGEPFKGREGLKFYDNYDDGYMTTLLIGPPGFPANYADFYFQLAGLQESNIPNEYIVGPISNEKSVRVDPSPYISAGPDQIIQNSDIVLTNLTGEACYIQDDGTKIQVPSVQWEIEKAPEGVSFSNPNSTITNVTLPEPGFYTLSLDDNDPSSYKDFISIIVYSDDAFTNWDPENPVFEDDFYNYNISNLTIPDPDWLWSIKEDLGNNSIYITNTWYPKDMYGGPGTKALIKPLKIDETEDEYCFDNFNLTFDARTLDTEDGLWGDFCAIFNYRDEENYYFIEFNKYAIIYYNVESGERTEIKSEKCYLTEADSYYSFEIIVHNNTVSVSQGENVLLIAEDDTHEKGLIGFGSIDDAAAFANIAVEADPDNLPLFSPYAVKENFNNGDALGWSPVTPNYWTIQEIEGSNVYSQTATDFPVGFGDRYGSYEPLNEYSLVADKSFGDFEFSCKARIDREITGSTWWADLAVVFGYQNPTNYYYFEFTREWQASALVKVVDNTAHFIARPGTSTIDDNEYHRIKVRRDSANIQVFIDNTLLVDVDDTTFTTGQIGVGTYNDPCTFDNILVDAIEFVAPEPKPVVFYDNFQENGKNNWSFLNENFWALTEDSYGDTSLSIISNDYPHPSQGKPGEYALLDSMIFEDFEFECDAKVSGAELGRYCFIFNYVNENNFYYMEFAYNNDQLTKLYKVESGTSTVVKEATYCHLMDTLYHKINIIKDGPAICVKSRNTTVLFVYDETFTKGQIGLATYHAKPSFDNVIIYADTVYSMTPPALVFEDNFDDGDSEGWTRRNENRWGFETPDGDTAYSIITSDYSPQYPTNNHVGEYSTIDSLVYTDFTFTCRAKSDESLGGWKIDYIIMFGMTAGDTYYWMTFCNHLHGNLLNKSVNGVIEDENWPKDCNRKLLTDNNYHDIMITRLGDRIRVYYDNIKVLDEIEPELITGKIGIGSYNDMATFDDIYLTDQVYVPTVAEGFSDNFSDGYADDWNEKSPSRWTVGDDNGNKYYYINTTNYQYTEYSIIDEPEFDDFFFTCNARTDENFSGNYYPDYRIIFAYENSSKYYFAQYCRWNNRTQIVKRAGGAETTLVSYPEKLVQDNDYHDIALEKLDGVITLYFDGDSIISVVDTTIGVGPLGLGSSDDKASFDNVSVTLPGLAKRTAWQAETKKVPLTYSLSQNYPNPFNPTTTIKYQLPEVSEVKLVIYNIMGQRVATLVDQNKDPGFYEIQWNGLNQLNQKVSTGIYIYRMEAKSKDRSRRFNKVKKMLFLK